MRRLLLAVYYSGFIYALSALVVSLASPHGMVLPVTGLFAGVAAAVALKALGGSDG